MSANIVSFGLKNNNNNDIHLDLQTSGNNFYNLFLRRIQHFFF